MEGELQRELMARECMGIRDFESATRVALAEGGGLGAGAREVLDLVTEVSDFPRWAQGMRREAGRLRRGNRK